MKGLRWRNIQKEGLKDWIERVTEIHGSKPDLGLEIGTFQGESTAILSEYTNHVITVDPYKSYEEYGQERLNKARDWFYKRKPDNVTHFNMFFSEFTKYIPFKDNSFDYIYVDGDHKYLNVFIDIGESIILGNIVGGHDYSDRFPGVVKAVNEWAEQKNKKIETFKDTSWLLV